jgi:prepilin-type N-terminal cleavage/methylation domain-containing protein
MSPRACKPSFARHRGFTLFELVITLTVIGVLAGVAAPMLFGGFRLFDVSTEALQTQDKLRYAVERMAREIREVQNNAGTYAITMAGATVSSLSFTKDDGTTVSFNGGAPPLLTMTDSSVAGTHTLTNEVTAVTFTGYALDGTTATNSQITIAFVEIALTLGNFSQRTRVALRNQP